MKNSLTRRASDAVKNGGKSADLRSLQQEVAQRIGAVDLELKSLQAETGNAERDGDLEALQQIRRKETDLQDEERVLLRQRSDLHQAFKTASGEEAIAAAGQHRKDLESALQRAMKAQEILSECQKAVAGVILARKWAKDIGTEIPFDADTIHNLATAAYPEGNTRKQVMLDLGIAASRLKAPSKINPGTRRER